eukprot:scaffold5954_cov144-Ochromonas_danica.AAC.2
MITLLTAHSRNASTIYVDDPLVPPSNELNQAAPPTFPTTYRQIMSLESKALNQIEDFYSFSHGGSLAARRARVRGLYGVKSGLRDRPI